MLATKPATPDHDRAAAVPLAALGQIHLHQGDVPALDQRVQPVGGVPRACHHLHALGGQAWRRLGRVNEGHRPRRAHA
ncbi:hypothetical protein ACWCXB_00640 [Streptomyces sp. NPDC001514]